MIDLSSLPEKFLRKGGRPISISALEAAAAATSTALPAGLRALYEAGVRAIGNVELFDEGLLDEKNVPAAPWVAALEQSQNPAERLLGSVYSDDRLPGFEGVLFFGADGGGVWAFVDGTNKMARGIGAIFAISPGAGDPAHAEFIAADFDAFVEKSLGCFRAKGRPVGLHSLTRER